MSMPNVKILGVPLSPTLSPVLAPLDDKNTIAQLPPLQLDEGGKGTGSMYRTSLSKLTEKSVTSANNNNESKREPRKKPVGSSRILRSTSPIRTAMSSQAPKMLKSEYMNSMTMWKDKMLSVQRTIRTDSCNVITAATALCSSNMPTSINSVIDHAKVRERQGPVNGDSNSRAPKPTVYSRKLRDFVPPRHAREMSTVSCLSGKTAYEAESSPATIGSPPFNSDAGFRFPSLSSTASSVSNSNYGIEENAFDFKGGSNRESIICGPLEDRLWMGCDDEIDPPLEAPTELTSTLDKNIDADMQSLRFELYIKRLELQIDQLKLQNDRLKHSIEYSAMQDRLLLEALQEARKVRLNQDMDMQKKLKRLEAKVEEYKNIIAKLTTSNGTKRVHHKVTQLDEKQILSITDEDSTPPATGDASDFDDIYNNTTLNSANITDENDTEDSAQSKARERYSKRHSRGWDLNLSINLE
ncbi:HCL550Cp [Eremothecium sinecaudum]|uniref:HCL550Cp n=1 Tax=Eremothecium sinecaudum TaxID=45286 RepID=A0A109UXY7_9SACH|nr:HCL550Cp [Eremothecium sinecaudum]AMD19601.1 HCL550Cp [Eremothecium sinecaudum]